LLNMYLLMQVALIPQTLLQSHAAAKWSYERGTARPDDIYAKASPKSPNQPLLQPLNPPLDSKRHLYLA
jgi:hypothetical protein